MGMYLCKQELADMPHHEILLYPSSRLIGPVTVAPSSKPQFLYVTIEKRTWGLESYRFEFRADSATVNLGGLLDLPEPQSLHL